jgi:nucleotide-binding universal stress UspA family protein
MSTKDTNLILVGVDGSPESRAAVRYAVHVAEQTGGEILLAHAYDPWPTESFDPTVDEFRRRSEEDARQVLETSAEPYTSQQVTIRTLAAGEKPGSLLGRLAGDARIAVVGQDTASLLKRLSFGSVARHLAATAACPVVIVPDGWHRKKFGVHPVVAVTDDLVAPEVLQVAVDEGARIGRAVVVVRAVPYLASRAEVEQEDSEFHQVVAASTARHPAVPIRSLVLRGDINAQVIRQSVDASAVVVGRPPRHGITTWLRSTAHALVKRTHCPLIVVPTAAGSAHAEPVEARRPAAHRRQTSNPTTERSVT